MHGGVLFIGINLVGGKVHDSNEWSQRMTDNANWVNENINTFGSQVSSLVLFAHAAADGDRSQFGDDFVISAQNFGKPILYMMGDKHAWKLDKPFSEALNVTRVIVDQGPLSVRVTITHDETEPFLFDRSPLIVQSSNGKPTSVDSLAADQLAPIVDAAIWRLSQSGSSFPEQLPLSLEYQVVDLPGDLLGRVMTGVLQIDADAAGFGWYVDATPHDDAEFIYDAASHQAVAYAGQAVSRVDLLTTVLHELGHLLGLDHGEPHRVMDAELPLGTRRLRLATSDHSFDTGLGWACSTVDSFYGWLGSLGSKVS